MKIFNLLIVSIFIFAVALFSYSNNGPSFYNQMTAAESSEVYFTQLVNLIENIEEENDNEVKFHSITSSMTIPNDSMSLAYNPNLILSSKLISIWKPPQQV